MLRITATSRRGTLALAALLLVATSCGGDTTADAPSMPASSDTVVTAVDSVPATDAATATTATEVTASAATTPVATVTVDMTDLAQCLTGRWTLGAEQVQGVFDNTALASVSGASVVTSGSGLLDLRADGTFTFAPSFALTLTVDDEVAEGQWSGTQAGVWSAEGTTLTMTDVSNDISGTITLFGAVMPLPQPASFSGAAEIVDCSPMTFETAVDSPVGVISQVLVLAE